MRWAIPARNSGDAGWYSQARNLPSQASRKAGWYSKASHLPSAPCAGPYQPATVATRAGIAKPAVCLATQAICLPPNALLTYISRAATAARQFCKGDNEDADDAHDAHVDDVADAAHDDDDVVTTIISIVIMQKLHHNG